MRQVVPGQRDVCSVWCVVDGHFIREHLHQRDTASPGPVLALHRNAVAPTPSIIDGHGEGVGITVVGGADVDRSALRGGGIREFGGVCDGFVYRQKQVAEPFGTQREMPFKPNPELGPGPSRAVRVGGHSRSNEARPVFDVRHAMCWLMIRTSHRP